MPQKIICFSKAENFSFSQKMLFVPKVLLRNNVKLALSLSCLCVFYGVFSFDHPIKIAINGHQVFLFLTSLFKHAQYIPSIQSHRLIENGIREINLQKWQQIPQIEL